MVAESGEELIKHFTTADLDTVADVLLEKASDSFLDKCLAKRLLTIEAKPLVNALARAERLGYDPTDVVLEDRHERVVVQEAFPGAPAPAPKNSTPINAQSGLSAPAPMMQCNRCFRTFSSQISFDYVSAPASSNGIH